MGYLLALMFTIIGFCFGKKVLQQTAKRYDLNLLLVAFVFFVLGGNTQVFRIYDFKGMLSMIVPPFILGVLIRRSIYKYRQKSKSSNDTST